MQWKQETSYLLCLVFLLLCLLLGLHSAVSAETPESDNLSKKEEKQSLNTTERLLSFEEKLKNLEELAEQYLQELNQSELDWETFLQKYNDLQIAVEELMLSVEYWSTKYNSLLALYEKVVNTLEVMKQAQKELEAARMVEELKAKMELRVYQVCAIVSTVLAVVGWSAFFLRGQ